ncbi:hypothetical protein O159_07660 [Leifsonia xyli subsp. cynodontis DSM 46306]|uniref:Uncharacterized protein n=1 Tax=Leifsonia xyli subsp. cynodontis DSM 46306 TaxID=1389489 RepID=U3P658_LEIXC|nr:hypothetical protein O159_07660 [Leifsonia xyli subsp. cynodontis DSM 46306]
MLPGPRLIRAARDDRSGAGGVHDRRPARRREGATERIGDVRAAEEVEVALERVTAKRVVEDRVLRVRSAGQER